MPELAETFIIAHQLAGAFGALFESDADYHLPTSKVQPQVFGRSRIIAESLDKVYAEIDDCRFFLNSVQHQGKKIWLVEDTSKMIEVSLGMTGRFSLTPTDHDRVAFHVVGEATAFYYSDIRKFGTLREVSKKAEIAPSACGSRDFEIVLRRLRERPSWPIKRAITDQKLAVSGIGNYASNELLYAGGIHPDMLVRDVSDDKIKDLLFDATELFAKAIDHGGCTLRDFKDINGQPGMYQCLLNVYGKKKCLYHEALICKSGSPTSYFCPQCQPLKTAFTTSENLLLTSE
jgi:formamidopyrimidine-DNA glycosylase